MSATKYRNLSILLIKSEFRNFTQIIRDDPRIATLDVQRGTDQIGKLYVKAAVPVRPKWSSFFDGALDLKKIGLANSVAAALLVETEGNIFAVTFGPGRFLLRPDCWIERFGLRVALNSIGKDRIRTIDKTTFDAISLQSKEQASKETDAENFGLDVEQDLLRAVTGVPTNPQMGNRIYGMDSLSISINIKIEGIRDLLQRIYAKYTDDSYKKDFPWVDHINEVKDKSTTEALDSELISRISTGKIAKIWAAVPEILEWDQVGGFCFKMYKNSPEFQDIHLQDFIDSLTDADRENISKETFTKKHVHCIHLEGHLMRSWQMYKCLYCELDQGNETYLLNGGRWYAVASDFVASVNQSYSDIPDYNGYLPKYNDDSEGKYNLRVCKEMSTDFALMDEKMIRHGGGQSQIEFCDLLSAAGDIIHVKRYGHSSVLSHLFAQGRVSGELFQMDPEFRDKVSEELPAAFKIKNTKDRTEKRRIPSCLCNHQRCCWRTSYSLFLKIEPQEFSQKSERPRVQSSQIEDQCR